jgi:hypothetical protein
MSTRSRIAFKREDGLISSIYCHWDGYPSNNGKILQEHYQDVNKIKQLIVLGSLSILGPEIGEIQDFSNPTDRNWCLFYGRDRGEKDTGHDNHKSIQELIDAASDSWGEYVYLFEDGEWKVADIHGSKEFVPLVDVLKTKNLIGV